MTYNRELVSKLFNGRDISISTLAPIAGRETILIGPDSDVLYISHCLDAYPTQPQPSSGVSAQRPPIHQHPPKTPNTPSQDIPSPTRQLSLALKKRNQTKGQNLIKKNKKTSPRKRKKCRRQQQQQQHQSPFPSHHHPLTKTKTPKTSKSSSSSKSPAYPGTSTTTASTPTSRTSKDPTTSAWRSLISPSLCP